VGVRELEVKCKMKDISERKKKKKTIIITGDSRATGRGFRRHKVDTSFEVQGFVKPGTDVATVTNTAKEDTEKLTKKGHSSVKGGNKGRGKKRD
jgi:hypothetical protein